MKFIPKRTKYRKYQKGRTGGCRPDGTQLSFGRYGITCIEAGRISSQVLEAARRAISRKFRRIGRIYCRVCADISVSKKPLEVRMGKGKGQPAFWVARVVKGQILFEMDGISLSKAKQAAYLAEQKLNIRARFIEWS